MSFPVAPACVGKHYPRDQQDILQPLAPPHHSCQNAGVDLLERCPDSFVGNRWVSVAVYNDTWYALTRPLLTGTAVDIAEFVLHVVILKHCAPREVVSERSRPFVSRVVVAENLRPGAIIVKRRTAYNQRTIRMV